MSINLKIRRNSQIHRKTPTTTLSQKETLSNDKIIKYKIIKLNL